MRSRVVRTILLSTSAARQMAESLCSMSPQYAFPPDTLIPCEKRRLATFLCEGYLLK